MPIRIGQSDEQCAFRYYSIANTIPSMANKWLRDARTTFDKYQYQENHGKMILLKLIAALRIWEKRV